MCSFGNGRNHLLSDFGLSDSSQKQTHMVERVHDRDLSLEQLERLYVGGELVFLDLCARIDPSASEIGGDTMDTTDP